MTHRDKPKICIVNYGVGNLFSIQQACEHAGMDPEITYSKSSIENAEGVILPGVGAFGDAMEVLRRLNLVEVLRKVALEGKPFMGICLGMQLLAEESFEFGRHAGLGIIQGQVCHLGTPLDTSGKRLKVPHIGWNGIRTPHESCLPSNYWDRTVLEGISNDEPMYFVHSFYVKPANPDVILSMSSLGDVEFCSSLRYKNVFAVQFHPERSGSEGLAIYRNFKKIILSAGESWKRN